jgi:hypothetical protein
MARRYSIEESMPLVTADTVLALEGTTAVRPRLYDIIIGCGDTPADQASEFLVSRKTVAGTHTNSPTPNPLDPDEPAAVAVGAGTFTVEPTIGVTLLRFAMNQRATFRWVASPGSELIVAAAAEAGISIAPVTPTSAWNAQVTFLFEE